MKVLLLIDGMEIGGAETHVLTLANALKSKGIEIALMCAGGTYAKALADSGVCVYYAPFKERSLRGVRMSIRALKRRKKDQFTVIHAHTRYTAALANLCLPDIPLVTTVHLNFCITPLRRTLSCWGRRSLAVSSDLKDYLVKEYKVRKNAVSLTVNGIDPSQFPPLHQRGKNILHVSRLDRDRSQSALLLCAIAPRLYAYAPHIRIQILGTGDDAGRVHRAAEVANQCIGRTVVQLFGACDRVSEKMENAAMLIGVSRAALEGACRGLPVILSGNDGYGGILTKEVYETEKASNFCCRNRKKANEEDLFRDITYLLRHACLCEHLRARISALVRREYTPMRMAEDAIAAYYGALRIGAIGYYGFGNFGDEMMLRALRWQLAQKGVHNFYPLLKTKESLLSRYRPLRTVYHLRKCDYVLFGGGNLFQNETSLGSLLYYAVLLRLCKKRTRIAACMGIGALRSRLATRICRDSLNGFRMLFLRSETDAEATRRLAPGIASRIHTCCDLCFFLPQIAPTKKSKNKIVAIPTSQCEADLRPFLKEMQHQGAQILLAVLFPQKDMKCARRLSMDLNGCKIQCIQSQEDFLSCMEEARLCISMRLHGAIFSLLSHTPCLLSAHSEKNRAWIADVQIAADHCNCPAPVLAFLSSADAIKKEREAAGKTYGFSEIISFFRERGNY